MIVSNHQRLSTFLIQIAHMSIKYILYTQNEVSPDWNAFSPVWVYYVTFYDKEREVQNRSVLAPFPTFFYAVYEVHY